MKTKTKSLQIILKEEIPSKGIEGVWNARGKGILLLEEDLVSYNKRRYKSLNYSNKYTL